MAYMGKKSKEKKWRYVYIWLIDFAVQQKHNIANQLYSNKSFFKKSKKGLPWWRSG